MSTKFKRGGKILYYSGFCFVERTDPRISELEDTSLRVLQPVLGLQGRPPARPALGRVVPGWKARTSALEARESGGEAAAGPATPGPGNGLPEDGGGGRDGARGPQTES